MEPIRTSALETALIAIERALGTTAVITDPDVLASYRADESETPPVTPDAVVRATCTEDVAAVLRTAHEHGIAVTPRAAGTGRVGGAVPVQGGIVLAFERMNRIKGIEPSDMVAVVEPGVVTGELHAAVEELGLFYPPDPNSLEACAIGGNIANNAGGPRAVRYGVTRDYVLGMEAVTPDGTVLQLGKRTTKGVTGYDLASLVVGSEGTLAVVTEATLKLIPRPAAVATLMVLLPDLPTAGHAVNRMLALGILPRCIEMLDDETLAILRPQCALPIDERARAMLIIEIDGDEASLDGHMERAGNALDEVGALDVLVARHSTERERLWSARRELSRALRQRAAFKLAEDVVVPRRHIPELIDSCRRISERYDLRMPSYGHAGDGNIHVNFLWDDSGQWPTVEQAIEAMLERVIELGGTLSGEHGIGVLKARHLPLEQSADLIALQERIKTLFDPRGILNPGKIFPAQVRRFHGPC